MFEKTNIPIPTNGKLTGATAFLKTLEIGESFTVSDSETRGGIYQIARQIGIKVKTQKTVDGFTVWRTA